MTRPVIALLTLTAAVACVTGTRRPTFEVLDASRLATVRRIAVLPIDRYPVALSGHEDRFVQVTDLLVAGLREKGYEVLEPATHLRVLREKADERGVDLRPGRTAPVDLEALRSDTLAELFRSYGVEATASGSLEWREAALSGTHAVWDGASQSVRYQRWSESSQEYPDFFRGTVPALSLHLRVSGADDRELYTAYGGLHVGVRIDQFANRHDVSAEELLSDFEYVERSVSIALAGLRPRG